MVHSIARTERCKRCCKTPHTGYDSPEKCLQALLTLPGYGKGLLGCPSKSQAFLVLCKWFLGQSLSNGAVGQGDPRHFLEPCHTLVVMDQNILAPLSICPGTHHACLILKTSRYMNLVAQSS